MGGWVGWDYYYVCVIVYTIVNISGSTYTDQPMNYILYRKYKYDRSCTSLGFSLLVEEQSQVGSHPLSPLFCTG